MIYDDPRSIVLSMEPRVRAWFLRRVTDTQDAEDLTQDCMCAIIEGHARFRGESSPETWVYGICRNLWFRYQRIRDRRPGRLAEEPRDEREADSEAALQMRLAAQALPARLGIVYELYYCRGLRIGEVASFLERPPGTVKYQLHEIRSFLRRRLT
jgi:RNA polymerase sigma-70 factor (ECF subfamily)